MIGQIRLAERRGLLTGPGAGRVQVAALAALMVHEAVVRAEEALAYATQPFVGIEAPEDDPAPIEAVLKGDEPLSWSATESFSQDDVMGILSEIGRGGTITLDDVEG